MLLDFCGFHGAEAPLSWRLFLWRGGFVFGRGGVWSVYSDTVLASSLLVSTTGAVRALR